MRRTWLFVAGADAAAHRAAARSGADVIVLELEDFTPPELRPRARALSASAFQLWRKSGALAAVRVNPLQADGLEDLAGIELPDVLMMSKV
ncbi:MAG TPA: aldolase/citrate lyase family protein, partial [Burkholderiales bacterium]|nr:aldolase/citrate lyase family protein [Burkholderiales bacterium]